MEKKQQNVENLWRRLEDAKYELDRAHQQITKAKQERISGAVPSADGNFAHIQDLRAHELAVRDYLKALGDLKAALLENQQVDAQAEPEAISQVPPDGDKGITPREREVLALIASGKSSRQVAVHLGIAFRTVVCHRYRLCQKLKVHNSVDLIRTSVRMGLIEL